MESARNGSRRTSCRLQACPRPLAVQSFRSQQLKSVNGPCGCYRVFHLQQEQVAWSLRLGALVGRCNPCARWTVGTGPVAAGLADRAEDLLVWTPVNASE